MNLECILSTTSLPIFSSFSYSLFLVPTQRVFLHRITNSVTFVSLPYLFICNHQFLQPSALPQLKFLGFLAASFLRITGYMLNPVFSVFVSFGLNAFWHSWSCLPSWNTFFFFFLNLVSRISDWPCFFCTFWTFSQFPLLILPKSLRPQIYMSMSL